MNTSSCSLPTTGFFLQRVWFLYAFSVRVGARLAAPAAWLLGIAAVAIFAVHHAMPDMAVNSQRATATLVTLLQVAGFCLCLTWLMGLMNIAWTLLRTGGSVSRPLPSGMTGYDYAFVYLMSASTLWVCLSALYWLAITLPPLAFANHL